MTLHYHGTPMSPDHANFALAGRHVCVSFADEYVNQTAATALAVAQSIMWDNGAFGLHKRLSESPHKTSFSAWVRPKLAHPHWAVIPDVIDGTVEDQRALVAKWPHPAMLSAPVWHLHLSLDWLAELSDSYSRICFGSSKEYWQVLSPAWQNRVDEAFNFLDKRGPLPWIHMMRGLEVIGKRWPFASADSSNVARSFRRNGEDAQQMMDRFDMIQSPHRWIQRPTDKGLF